MTDSLNREAPTGPAPDRAPLAGLERVHQFGPNPSGLAMYVYRPERLPPRPAALVMVHNCTGSGPLFHATFAREFAERANGYGYLIIYPTSTRDGSCFDVSSPAALTADGPSDPMGIESMVQLARSQFGVDPSRVFAAGLSSGAMMTNVLLARYPDTFAAGAAFAGVPFGGFATHDGSSWNDDCAAGRVSHSSQHWGDLVRSVRPHTAGQPRIQLWHGTEDDILNFRNLGEMVKQWTNVHGVGPTPALSDQPESGWQRDRYGSTGPQAPVEAIRVNGGPHNVLAAGMADYALRFFGLVPEDGLSPAPA